MKRIALAVACLLPGAAQAQQVYKCAGPQGPIYQSLPCPQESDTGQTLRYVKDPRLTSDERARNARMLDSARRRMQAEAGRGSPPVRGVVIEAASDPEGCDEAKSRREFVEAFGGKARASRLDSEVRQACQHR